MDTSIIVKYHFYENAYSQSILYILSLQKKSQKINLLLKPITMKFYLAFQ